MALNTFLQDFRTSVASASSVYFNFQAQTRVAIAILHEKEVQPFTLVHSSALMFVSIRC